jgi:hypothetical protein
VKDVSPNPSDAVYFDLTGEVKMILDQGISRFSVFSGPASARTRARARPFGLAALLAVASWAAAMPDASADTGPGAERVVAAVRDLFPEIDSQASLDGAGGEPVVRLTARVTFDAARARVRLAFDSARVLAAGALLGPPVDRAATGSRWTGRGPCLSARSRSSGGGRGSPSW